MSVANKIGAIREIQFSFWELDSKLQMHLFWKHKQ